MQQGHLSRAVYAIKISGSERTAWSTDGTVEMLSNSHEKFYTSKEWTTLMEQPRPTAIGLVSGIAIVCSGDPFEVGYIRRKEVTGAVPFKGQQEPSPGLLLSLLPSCCEVRFVLPPALTILCYPGTEATGQIPSYLSISYSNEG